MSLVVGIYRFKYESKTQNGTQRRRIKPSRPALYLRLSGDGHLWRDLYVGEVARGREVDASRQRVVDRQRVWSTLSHRRRQLDRCHDARTHGSELYLVVLILS